MNREPLAKPENLIHDISRFLVNGKISKKFRKTGRPPGSCRIEIPVLAGNNQESGAAQVLNPIEEFFELPGNEDGWSDQVVDSLDPFFEFR